MKNRVVLLAITIVTVTALAFVMGGCSCNSKKTSNKETTVNVKDVPTNKIVKKGKGSQVAKDQFESISPIEKTTDKKGNTIVKYTNAQGYKVTRTTDKNGTVKIVIKNKKGKVINTRQFKDPNFKKAEEAVKESKKTTKKDTKKDSKKDNKKDDKKDDKNDDKKEGAGVANDNDNWSDFY